MKYNILNGDGNIKVKTLLDAFGCTRKNVETNVTKTGSDTNNYQDRTTIIGAHKEAERMLIELTEIMEMAFGQYKVKSSKGERFYTISYIELCERLSYEINDNG